MTFGSRLHRLFPSDLAIATAYYDGISVELADRFRDRVRIKLAQIRERPKSFGFTHQTLRAAMIDGFPYLLLFRVVNSKVYVAGLYHASSNPNSWLVRNIEY